jgi:hypothetical protein
MAYCEAALDPRCAELRRLAERLIEPPGGAGSGGPGGEAAGAAETDGSGPAPDACAAPPGEAERDAERLVRRWWDARYVWQAGRPATAARLLNPLRVELLARGSLAEAVQVSLEQAEVLAPSGLPAHRRLDRLGTDLLESFGPRAAGRVALELAELAQLAHATRWVPVGDSQPAAAAARAKWRQIRAGLHRLRRHERVRPPLIRDVASLVEECLAAENLREIEEP